MEELREERETRKAEREDAAQLEEPTSRHDELEPWTVEDALWERQLEHQRKRLERERERQEISRVRARCRRLERRMRMLSRIRDGRTRLPYPPSSGLGGALGAAVPLLLTVGVAYLASRASENAPNGTAPPPRCPQPADPESDEKPEGQTRAMLTGPTSAAGG